MLWKKTSNNYRMERVESIVTRASHDVPKGENLTGPKILLAVVAKTDHCPRERPQASYFAGSRPAANQRGRLHQVVEVSR